MSDPLAQFARKIGWRVIPGAKGYDLGKFKEIYERRCSWPVMGYGSLTCSETGEQYATALRSFAADRQVWHIYERTQRGEDRSTYLVTYSLDRNTWQDLGYFNRWPRRWNKPEKNLIGRLFALYMKLRYRNKLKSLIEMKMQERP